MPKAQMFVPNDGVMRYGRIETTRDEMKRKSGESFKELGHLKFDYSSIRQEDVESYKGTDKGVDLKIRTYFRPDVPTSLKVIVGNDKYDISNIDPAIDRKTMFWYLQKVGVFNDSRQVE